MTYIWRTLTLFNFVAVTLALGSIEWTDSKVVGRTPEGFHASTAVEFCRSITAALRRHTPDFTYDCEREVRRVALEVWARGARK